MPQSAFFSAGASFTPSPVMPTMCPRFCSTSTMWNLCSGNTWAKPSASSMASTTCRALVVFDSSKHRWHRGYSCRGRARLAISLAMASWSPVTILTSTPIVRAVAMVALAVLARRIEQRQYAKKLPVARRRRPAPRRANEIRAPANSLTASSTAALISIGIGRQRHDHLRRALGDLEHLCRPGP